MLKAQNLDFIAMVPRLLVWKLTTGLEAQDVPRAQTEGLDFGTLNPKP